MLMARLTAVFNIMISKLQKIDYITSSLFTRRKKKSLTPQHCGINTVRENNTVLCEPNDMQQM